MKKYLLTIIPTFLSVALFGAAIFWFVLPKTEETFLAQKAQMSQELVNTAWSILAGYQKRETQGLTSRKQAQSLALREIRELRYGPDGKDYFWISDTRPFMIMHPYRSDLDGSDLSGYKDPNGKRLFVEMAEVAESQGSGFVAYGWQWKDDPARVAPKLSYVKLFPPWGWVIGTGMYTKDVETEMASMTRTLTIVGAGVLALVTLLSMIITIRGLKMERERARAVQELTQSEERFRSITSGALDGIVMMDPGGKISFWNRAAQEIFGYTESEVLGRQLHSTLAPSQYLDEYLSAFGGFNQSGRGKAVGKTMELTAQRKDGSEFPIELSVSSLSLEGQWHAVGIVRDITKRYEAARRLSVSERNYRTVFNTSNEAILILDSEEARMIDANRRAGEMFGRSLAQILELEIEDICTSEPAYSAHEARKKIQMAIDGSAQSFQWLFRRDGGEEFWGEVNLETAVINDRQRLLAYIEDISDKKRAEAEKQLLELHLRQAQKLEAIGTLAGGIAHDFNNLLTVILGFSQVAQLKMSPAYLPMSELEEIEAAGRRAQELVSQILTYSRQSSTEKKAMDIVPLIKESLKLVGSTLPSNIEIQADLEPAKAPVLGNGTQVQQIILNLATNAAHAMKESGGAFKIGLHEAAQVPENLSTSSQLAPGPYFRLTVEDQGTGMDATVLNNIFDPFYSTKKQGEGTGLGLSVVMGIVKDHGGAIKASSQTGVGSSFEIYLPQHQGPEPGARETGTELTQGQGRILFVDDQESVLQAISAMLTQVGYRVTALPDAEQALAKFDADPGEFDLVIMDYDMPGMNGLALAKKILATSPQTPVIIISGSCQKEIAEKALALGVNRVLFKPLPMGEFTEIIKQEIS